MSRSQRDRPGARQAAQRGQAAQREQAARQAAQRGQAASQAAQRRRERRLLMVVVAAVVLHEGQPLDVDSLQEHVRGVLTAYKVPRRFVAVAELPRNPLGKVLRREVAKLVTAPPM